MKKRNQKKKREQELKQIHIEPESSYNIIHRLPTVGDTTVAYDYNGILGFYDNAESYVREKLASGIKFDSKNRLLFKEDIQLKHLMLKALQLEIRERHRNARISINQEKRYQKQRLEYELEQLLAKYEELKKEGKEE